MKITNSLLKQLDAQTSYVTFLENLHFVLYFFFISMWTSSCTSDSMYFKVSGVRQGLLDTCPQEAVFQALAHFFVSDALKYRRNYAKVVHTFLLIVSCMAWFWCTWRTFPWLYYLWLRLTACMKSTDLCALLCFLSWQDSSQMTCIVLGSNEWNISDSSVLNT